MMLGLALAWAVILGGGWLGWQLLRQNGRMLLRLDELEKRLNELELGESGQPEGLPVGTEAPAFELPDLAGQSRTLAEFRGQPLLLIFFNPACGFCRDLATKLAAVHNVESRKQKTEIEQSTAHNNGQTTTPAVLIVSTGDAETNRTFFEEHKLACLVLLQHESEVTAAYQANGTPSGYLISPEGRIASALAIGVDALLALLSGPRSRPSTLNPEPAANGRESRFRNRSLAGSRLKRDGLKAGTTAPSFRLPRLDGHGELALSDLRGQRVLLVFSSPNCGPCNTLAPELEKFYRSQNGGLGNGKPVGESALSPSDGERVADRPGEGKSPGIAVVMLSKGEPKENRAKVKEHRLTFPILLQQQWEISRLYAIFATPVAYLIDEHGVLLKDVAAGVEPIQQLMSSLLEPALRT